VKCELQSGDEPGRQAPSSKWSEYLSRRAELDC